MALTPEEVINKRFQATKFKEGYNPEEVDDFLDEIVIELRRLNAENSSLKRQLEEADERLAEAEANASKKPSNNIVVEEKKPVAAPAAVVVPEAPAEPAPNASGSSSAAALLAMAQKVHDDYVFEGKRQKDILVTEGRDKAQSLVGAAQEERARVLGDLEATKSALEATVAKLRVFENQYRTGLRTFIEDQLTGLESSPLVEKTITIQNR